MYEGHPARSRRCRFRVSRGLGIGTLHPHERGRRIPPELRSGTVMLIADQINLTFGTGSSAAFRVRSIPDMSERPRPGVRRWLGRSRATESPLRKASTPGCRTELRDAGGDSMLERLGADAVGIST